MESENKKTDQKFGVFFIQVIEICEAKSCHEDNDTDMDERRG